MEVRWPASRGSDIYGIFDFFESCSIYRPPRYGQSKPLFYLELTITVWRHQFSRFLIHPWHDCNSKKTVRKTPASD